MLMCLYLKIFTIYINTLLFIVMKPTNFNKMNPHSFYTTNLILPTIFSFISIFLKEIPEANLL